MTEILHVNQISKLSNQLDDITIERISNNRIEKFESYNNCNIINFDWLDVKNVSEKCYKEDQDNITICQFKESIVLICDCDESINRLNNFVTDNYLHSKPMFYFFSSLLRLDADLLDDFEERITDTEDTLLEDSIEDYTKSIISFRKELLMLKRYYEQFEVVFDGFLENENHILTDYSQSKFKLLDKRIDRLLTEIRNLRDYVTQVREAYQAQIDIQQNNLMKIFTVVTTIFTPLTLVAGWYGMNLKMPEFEWEYGYIFVILISLAVIIGLIAYFRRKKWL